MERNETTNRKKKMQIGTNNCTARYRTLSGGGIGESPSLSPSPSSDYDDDEAATKQPHLPTLNCSSKNKRNGSHKGAIISQKATVHHVSTLTQKSFAGATTTFSIRLFFFFSLSLSFSRSVSVELDAVFVYFCLLSSRILLEEVNATSGIGHFDS